MSDPVNHPKYYAEGRIEVIEALEDWKLDFHRANAVKYIARAGKKDPRQGDRGPGEGRVVPAALDRAAAVQGLQHPASAAELYAESFPLRNFEGHMSNKLQVSETTTISADVLAEEIVKISAAMKQLNASRLSRDAIVALIHDNSKVSKGVIKIVLNNLDSLEATWLKKKL